MSRLPNEILDLIWLERCKLGFEPRILQPKWIDVAHMRVPAFYVAQPQSFMTQLCHGARDVAAKGFYSRVFDNPSTRDGGFWWSEEDVLYIDNEFYRELHPSRKAFVLGRDKITRVALDAHIDEDSISIVEFIAEWFPNLSQVCFISSARFISHWMADLGCTMDYPLPDPNESAITKSFPITAFHRVASWLGNSKYKILCDQFIRVQGLTGLLNELMDLEDKAHFLDYVGGGVQFIAFFIFDRVDTSSALGPNGSFCEHGCLGLRKMTLEDVQTDIAEECLERFQDLIERNTSPVDDSSDDERPH